MFCSSQSMSYGEQGIMSFTESTKVSYGSSIFRARMSRRILGVTINGELQPYMSAMA